ncbi:MAG: HAD family phosphatase [Candidatus Nanoarchaeia archaeon]|nr:HAD family phosphatase [Candidatus Nanoarchaeia archaeon]
MKRFKAIIFDLGGVLSLGPRNNGVHSFVAKKLGMNLDTYFDSIDEVYADAITGKISPQKALKVMARNLNTNPEKLERFYLQSYKKNFKRDNTLYNFALNLKKKGYKISILSDIWKAAREAILTEEKYGKFDDIVTSYEVGVRKTNPRIFRVALKRLNVKPGEAIFTDNRVWNLIAPRKLGITAILYKNPQQFVGDLKKLGIK